MSTYPIQWRNEVIENYGSVANFHDVSTVEIVRSQISTRRAELKTVLDLEISDPEALFEEQLAKMRSQDAELAALDQELAQWQADRTPAEV